MNKLKEKVDSVRHRMRSRSNSVSNAGLSSRKLSMSRRTSNSENPDNDEAHSTAPRLKAPNISPLPSELELKMTEAMTSNDSQSGPDLKALQRDLMIASEIGQKLLEQNQGLQERLISVDLERLKFGEEAREVRARLQEVSDASQAREREWDYERSGLKRDLHQAQLTIQELREEVRDLGLQHDEAATLKETVTLLDESKRRLEESLLATNRELKHTDVERQSLAKTVTELHDQLGHFNRINTTLKTGYKRQIDEYQEMISRLQNDKDQLAQQIKEMSSKIIDVGVASGDNYVDSVRSLLDAVRLSNPDLPSFPPVPNTDELNAVINQQQLELAHIRKENNELQEFVRGLQDTVTQLEEERQLQLSPGTLQHYGDSSDPTRRTNSGSVQWLRKEITGQVKLRPSRIPRRKAEAARVATVMIVKPGPRPPDPHVFLEFQSKILLISKKLRAQKVRYSQHVEELEDKLADATQTAEIAVVTAEEKYQEIESLVSRLTASNSEIEDLRVTLDEATRRISDQETSLRKAIADLQTTETETSSMKAKLRQVEDYMNELEDTLDQFQESAALHSAQKNLTMSLRQICSRLKSTVEGLTQSGDAVLNKSSCPQNPEIYIRDHREDTIEQLGQAEMVIAELRAQMAHTNELWKTETSCLRDRVLVLTQIVDQAQDLLDASTLAESDSRKIARGSRKTRQGKRLVPKGLREDVEEVLRQSLEQLHGGKLEETTDENDMNEESNPTVLRKREPSSSELPKSEKTIEELKTLVNELEARLGDAELLRIAEARHAAKVNGIVNILSQDDLQQRTSSPVGRSSVASENGSEISALPEHRRRYNKSRQSSLAHEDLSEKLAQTLAELEFTQSNLQDFLAEKDEVERKAEKLRQEVQTLQSSYAELENNQKSLLSDKEKLIEQLEDEIRERNNVQMMISEYKEREVLYSDKIAYLEQENNDLTNDVARLAVDSEQRGRMRTEIEGSAEKLQQEVEELRRSYNQLETSKNKLQSERENVIEQLENELREQEINFKNQICEYNEREKVYRDRIEELEKEVEMLAHDSSQFAEFKNLTESLEKEIVDQKAQTLVLESELAGLNAQLLASQNEFKSLELEHSETLQILEDLRHNNYEQLEIVERKFKEQKDQISNHLLEHEDREKGLSCKIAVLENERLHNEHQREALHNMVEQAIQNENLLKDKVALLEKRLEERKAENWELKADIARLKRDSLSQNISVVGDKPDEIDNRKKELASVRLQLQEDLEYSKEQLSKVLGELEEEKQSHSLDLNELERKAKKESQLRKELRKLEDILSNQAARIEVLEHNKSQLEERLRIIEPSLEYTDDKERRLKEHISSLEADLDQKDAQLDNLTATIEDVSSELQNEICLRESLEKQLEESRRESDELQRQLKVAAKNLQKSKQLTEIISGSIPQQPVSGQASNGDQLSTEERRLLGQLAELSERADLRKRRVDGLEQELAQKIQQVGILKQRIAELEERVERCGDDDHIDEKRKHSENLPIQNAYAGQGEPRSLPIEKRPMSTLSVTIKEVSKSGSNMLDEEDWMRSSTTAVAADFPHQSDKLEELKKAPLFGSKTSDFEVLSKTGKLRNEFVDHYEAIQLRLAVSCITAGLLFLTVPMILESSTDACVPRSIKTISQVLGLIGGTAVLLRPRRGWTWVFEPL